MTTYNNLKDFMRFINNAQEETIIKNAVVYDATGIPLAQYKCEENGTNNTNTTNNNKLHCAAKQSLTNELNKEDSNISYISAFISGAEYIMHKMTTVLKNKLRLDDNKIQEITNDV